MSLLHFGVALLGALIPSAECGFSSAPISLFSRPPVRLLAADENDEWARPPNDAGNYSAWESQFNHKLDTTCIAYDGTGAFESGVQVDERSPSKSLFASLRWTEDLHQFADVVKTEFGSSELTDYIEHKAVWIAFLCFGAVSLAVVIVLLFTFMRKFRLWCAKKVCRCIPTKKIPSHDPKSVVFAPITTGFVVGAFLVVSMLAFGIVCAVKAANFNQGIHCSFCDAFLSLKGYYFGAQSVQSTSEMVSDWKGAHIQWEEMKALEIKTTAGQDNPIRVEVVNEYETYVKPELTESSAHWIAQIEQMVLLMNDLDVMLSTLVTNLELNKRGNFAIGYPYPQTDLHWAYLPTAISLLEDYKTELAATTETGLYVIEQSIEQYLGDDSLLLKEAGQSTIDSLQSLDDVSFVIAGLAHDVVAAEEDLGAVFDALVAVFAIWATLAFALLIAGTTCYAFLFRARVKKEMPSPKIVPSFCALFICACLFGSISFILSGAMFLVGNVGGDACNFLEHTLLTDGNWDSLPAKMWQTTLHNRTDMRAVLNTCVRASGHGDVATSLGLISTLNKLEQTVEKTKAEMRLQVENVLQLDVKIADTESIQSLLSKAAAALWPRRFVDEVNYLAEDVWDIDFDMGTRYVTPLAMAAEEQPSTVFCFIPALGAPDITGILELCGANLTVQYIGVGGLMDVITAKATKYAAAGADVRHIWCIDSLNNDPNYPTGCDAAAVVIDNGWPTEDVLYNQQNVAATRDAIEAAAGVDEAKRWMDAIYTAVQIERVNSYVIQSADANHPMVVCPNGQSECTIPELIPFIATQMNAVGDGLMTNVEHTADVVNSFVEDTTIANMDAVLAEGYASAGNFNCQFVGSSLQHGLNYGLCHSTLPSVSMLALTNSFFFVCCLAVATIAWFQWHHLHRIFKSLDNQQMLVSSASEDEREMLKIGSVIATPPAGMITYSSASSSSSSSD